MRNFIITAFIAVFAVAGIIDAAAQRRRNNIYLFDCTASMKSAEINMWDEAKRALDANITRQSAMPDSRFTVIPFQDEPIKTIVFDGSDYGNERDKMQALFDKKITEPHSRTNILDAFEAGIKACDPSMENTIVLFTDGKDEVYGTDKLCERIKRWCSDHKNTSFIYLMLDGKGKDPEVEAALSKIRSAMEGCEDGYIVRSSDKIPQISRFSGTVIYASTLELDKDYSLGFSDNGEYEARAVCDNEFFEAEVTGNRINNGKLSLHFTPKGGLAGDALNDALAPYSDSDGNYVFTMEVVSAMNDMTIVNPEVTVVMANRAMRKLDILQGDTYESVADNEAHWHPAFLWSRASAPDTVTIDLRPRFNEAAIKDKSSAMFAVVPGNDSDGQPEPADYTLLLNGKALAAGEPIAVVPGGEARLGIVFDSDAREGKRHFTVALRKANELEIINGEAADELQGIAFRTEYHTGWNPLATALVCVAIALALAALLWFGLLRNRIYPKFKRMTLQLEGPGSYYLSKKLRGYRKVVFSDRKMSQSAAGRIFKGKVLFVKADHFCPAIEIEARGGKKGRMLRNSVWTLTPSSTIEPAQDYEAFNEETKSTFRITT